MNDMYRLDRKAMAEESAGLLFQRLIKRGVLTEESDEVLHVRCPSGCDLGERDDGNRRWDCDTCGGMGFVPVCPKEIDDG